MAFRVITIPGLGFTPAVFGRLDLGQPVSHWAWDEPQPSETLSDYARRVAPSFGPEDGTPIALIGHSFGGILAQEIAQQRSIQAVILVSSMKSRREIPLAMRAAAPLRIQHLFHRQTTLATLPLWGPWFGYDDPTERELFRTMVSQQSNRTLQWQLRELSRWQGVDLHGTTLDAFHGDRDKTLPFRKIQEPVARIPGGNHMMVFGRAEELNPLLRTCLQGRWDGLQNEPESGHTG